MPPEFELEKIADTWVTDENEIKNTSPFETSTEDLVYIGDWDRKDLDYTGIKDSPYKTRRIEKVLEESGSLEDAMEISSGDIEWSLRVTRGIDPITAANTAKLSKSLNMPPDTIKRNFKTAQELIEAKKTLSILDEVDIDNKFRYPYSRQWVINPEKMAQSKNDIGILTKTEQLIKEYTQKDEGFINTVYRTLGYASATTGKFIGDIPSFILGASQYPFNKALQLWGSDYRFGIPEYIKNNILSQFYKKEAETIKPIKLDENAIEQIKQGDYGKAAYNVFLQAVANAPQLMLLGMGGLAGISPEIVLTGAGLLEGVQSFMQDIDEGRDIVPAMEASLGKGAAEYIFERYTFNLFKNFGADLVKEVGEKTAKDFVTDFGKLILGNAFGEGKSEFYTTIAQDFSDFITGKPDAMKGTLGRAANSFLVGGLTGAGFGGAHLVTNYTYQKQTLTEANILHDKIVELNKDNILKKINPESYQSFLENIIAQSNVSKTLSISLDSLKIFFQEDKEGLDNVIKDLNLQDQIEDAETKGKELEINTAQWFSKYAGTPLDEAIKNDIRYDPINGMTMNEISTATNELAQDLREIQPEIQKTVEKERLPIQAEALRTALILPKNLGGFAMSTQDADANISLFMAGAKTLSQKAGETTQEWFNRINPILRIGGDGQVLADMIQAENLMQAEKGKPIRGAIQFQDTQTVINLFEKADMSTFLHETGHIFLKDIERLIDSNLADEQLQKDYKTLVEFADGKLDREGIEKIAKAFEVYLKEGKAPTKKLIRAFNKFREWLTAIYNGLRKLNLPITDEIRGVFSRMLASQNEIDEVQRYYKDKISKRSFVEALKLTKDKSEKLDKMLEKAREKAVEEQTAKALRIYYREIGGKKEIIEQAKNEIDNLPIYNAINFAVAQGKLNTQEIIDRFGESAAKQIKNNNPNVISNTGKLTFEELIFNSKYNDNPVELINDLTSAENRNTAINNRAKEIQIEREAAIRNIIEREETVPGEEAYHNEAQAEFLLEELKLIAEKTAREKGISAKRYDLKVYRDLAEIELSTKKVREAIAYGLFAKTEQKWAIKALFAAQNDNLEEAYIAKEKQMRNHAYVQASIKAKEFVDKTIKRFTKIKNSKKGTIPTEYKDAILYILNNYGLSEKGPSRPDIFNFNTIIESFENQLNPLPLPEIIINPKDINYKELTYSDFQELDAGIKMLANRGKNELNLTALGKTQLVKDKVLECVKPMLEKRKNVRILKKASLIDKTLQKARELLAETIHIQFDFKRADGYTNLMPEGFTGPNEEILDAIFTKRNDYIKSMQEFDIKYLNQISNKFEQISDRFRKEYGRKEFQLPNITTPQVLIDNGIDGWTAERILAIALNIGNEGNYNAVKEGFGLTDIDIRNIMGQLTADELRTIQTTWDAIDELFANMDDTFNRLNGYRLRKVAPKDITLFTKDFQTITLKGGYYPLSFDPELNLNVAAFNEQDILKNDMNAIYQRNTPRDSATKERKGGVYPIKLTIMPLYKHITDTLRYTHLAEVLYDAHKVFKNKDYANNYIKLMGKERYNLLTPWLSSIGRPSIDSSGFWDRVLTRYQRLAAIGSLAGKTLVGTKQVLSITSTARMIGVAPTAQGFYQLIKNPIETIKFVESLSSFMKDRGGKIEIEIAKQFARSNPFKKSITILGKKLTIKDLQDFSLINIRMGDILGAYSSWIGAFNKEFNKTYDEQKAIHFANKIVADTQPVINEMFNNIWQQGGIRRTSAGKIIRWVTSPFVGWTMKQGSMSRTIWNGWREGKISTKDFARHLAYERIMPPIGVVLLTGLLKGQPILKLDEYLYEIINYMLSPIPVLNAIPRALKYGTWSGVFELPIAPTVKHAEKAIKTTKGFIIDEKSFLETLMSYGEFAEYEAGVPVIQTAKDIKKIADSIMSLNE